METARTINDDISILPSYFPIPGFGQVPVNAFVLKAQQPVLVDTGLFMDSDAFMDQLRSVIDPQDLRWLWLTHPDMDHVGSLRRIMMEVPHLKLVTTFLGVGILSLTEPPAMDRVYLVNPGESLDVGDRKLIAYKPPAFDNPATTGFFETKTRTLFSSDCFGALVQSPADLAEDISTEDLREGQLRWATIDAPWLHNVDERKFAAQLHQVRAMDPARILSSHLPPATRVTETILSHMASVPGSQPFVGPNQVALEAMLASMTEGVAA